MYKLLPLAVILVFLLEPAAAAHPVLDHALSGVAMEHFYPDPEGVLSPICDYCAHPFFQCFCSTAPYVAAQMLAHSPTPYQYPLHPDPILPNLESVIAYNSQDRGTFSNMTNLSDTTVNEETMQAHVEDTYTPGDRTRRKQSHRRQAPRPGGGFPCEFEACDKAFDRNCELNRHRKVHLDPSKRPHQCPVCPEGFLYPKDLFRHQRKHADQPAAQVTFYCRYPGCTSVRGFSRHDNLLRHQRQRHPDMSPTT